MMGGAVFGDIKDKVITVLVEWIAQDHTSYLSQTPQTLSVEQKISGYFAPHDKIGSMWSNFDMCSNDKLLYRCNVEH